MRARKSASTSAPKARTSARAAVAACLLASLGPLGVASPPASAVVTSTDSGRAVSYQPTVAGARAQPALSFSAAALSTAGAYKECAGSQEVCLRYFGGPVMRTATLTPVFWNPAGLGLKYPSGYQTTIESFFTGLAADSGKEINFYSVLEQYHDTEGAISYTVSAGAPIEDSDALPVASSDRCSTPFEKSSRPCVQDSGVRAELAALVEREGLPRGIGHEYVVFFPPGIDSCFDAGGVGDANCSGSGYCGYHGTIDLESSGEEFEYANEPDNGDPRYRIEVGGESFDTCATREDLEPAEMTLSSTSHEISESATDPEVEEPALSWYDLHEFNKSQYGEVGDICAYEYAQGEAGGGLFKEHLVVPGSTSNQTIDGNSYLLQDEWDNAHSTCSLSAQAAGTKAAFTDDAGAGTLTGETVAFDGSQSHGPTDAHISSAISNYEWNWGDGTVTSGSAPTAQHAYASSDGLPTKTYTVKLTVTDANGNHASVSHTVEISNRPPSAQFTIGPSPVAGAPVSFDASGSGDPDGTIAAYEWDFGDGAPPQSVIAPSHTYSEAGKYTVTLRVTDDAGATASISHEISVAASPPSEQNGGKGEQTEASTRNNEETHLTESPTPLLQPATGKPAATPASAYVRVLSIKPDRRHGSIVLSLATSGAGAIGLHEQPKAKAKRPLVKPASILARSAGTVTIRLLASSYGRALLIRRHRLGARLSISFVPKGGASVTIIQFVTLTLSAKRK